jgi:hypothetical protein
MKFDLTKYEIKKMPFSMQRIIAKERTGQSVYPLLLFRLRRFFYFRPKTEALQKLATALGSAHGALE